MRRFVRSFEAHSGDYATKRSGQNGHSRAFAAELFFTRQLLRGVNLPNHHKSGLRVASTHHWKRRFAHEKRSKATWRGETLILGGQSGAHRLRERQSFIEPPSSPSSRPRPNRKPPARKMGKPRRSKGGNLIKRWQRDADGVLEFAFEANTSLPNHPAERGVRPVKVKQKVRGDFHTFPGVQVLVRL